jgi:nicotinate-nucleotide pyrophosphorylase (carboxylating)
MLRDLYCPPEFYIHQQVEQALFEDFGHGYDITSQTVLSEKVQATVHMVARHDLILSGLPWGIKALKLIDSNLKLDIHQNDASFCVKGSQLMTITGNARSIMSAERVVLNFIGHLSGVATLTHRYVEKIKHTSAHIVCTRKTLPNLRTAQKYAVRCGGGFSHRSGVDDMVLIKDNHIGVCGSIKNAINNARNSIGHTVKIEVECETLAQYLEALECRADIIMLDNMTTEQLTECVATQKETRQQAGVILEASGGVNLDTVKQIAETGVDVISIGNLTHSAPNADVAFDFAHLA